MGREAPHRARDAARDVPLEHSPYLGGGTKPRRPLETSHQHGHRRVFPGRNTLIDLLQDNDHNIVNQRGGVPEAVAGGRVRIAFEHGFLDISNFRPAPPYGHAVATVDGQFETVLSATRSCAATSNASTKCSSATSSTS